MPHKWQLCWTYRSCRVTRYIWSDEQVQRYHTITSCCTHKRCCIIISRCQRLTMPHKWQLCWTYRSCRVTRYIWSDEQMQRYHTITSCCTHKGVGCCSSCCQRRSIPIEWYLFLTDHSRCISGYIWIDRQILV